jgi:hypothetical protein
MRQGWTIETTMAIATAPKANASILVAKYVTTRLRDNL